MTEPISGRELRNARQRMGYRTQVDAAEAMRISVRLYADFERTGVPEKYEEEVRRIFWPARGAVDATPLSDVDLLEEVGRRWAMYRKDQQDALEPVEALRRDLRQALERAERAEAALAEFTAMATRYGSQNGNNVSVVKLPEVGTNPVEVSYERAMEAKTRAEIVGDDPEARVYITGQYLDDPDAPWMVKGDESHLTQARRKDAQADPAGQAS